MKIRNGFVSNSSSSSFIIKVPKSSLKSKDEFAKLLFGDDIPLLIPDLYSDFHFSSYEIINVVFNDIIENYKNEEYEIYNNIYDDINISYGNEEDINQYDKYIINEFREEYNDLKNIFIEYINKLKKVRYSINSENDIKYYFKLDEIYNKLKPIIAKSIILNKNDNEIIISLEYSDNDGSLFSYIEHSDVLKPITMKKINNH